jgi:heterotetrameric sarcosine oxidase gamma subunit
VVDFAHLSAFANLPLAVRGVIAQERHGLAIANVMARRGRSDALAAAVREQFDIALPQGPRCGHSDALTFLGSGPGRWLAIHSAPQPGFFTGFSQQLEGLASVVDQSSALGVVRLSGDRVLDVLAKGIAMDLDASVFPAGQVAVTRIAHIGVTLWKVNNSPSFDVAVARSYAGSFAHWLQAS